MKYSQEVIRLYHLHVGIFILIGLGLFIVIEVSIQSILSRL